MRSTWYEEWTLQNAWRSILQEGKTWGDHLKGSRETKERKVNFERNERGFQKNSQSSNGLISLSKHPPSEKNSHKFFGKDLRTKQIKQCSNVLVSPPSLGRGV